MSLTLLSSVLPGWILGIFVCTVCSFVEVARFPSSMNRRRSSPKPRNNDRLKLSMELAVSEMDFNVINQITCQLIKRCRFCHKMLDNGSKLLKCFHAICKYCIEKEMINLRIQCKCLTVTEGILVDCSIEPRNKMCSKLTCNTVANQICVDCNDFFCKLCSNVHLDMYDHILKDYLIEIESVSCSTCLTVFFDNTVKHNSYSDIEANSLQCLPLDKCVCCTQWTENLIECVDCHRQYHNDCHIPSLPKETTINDPIAKTWKCTMCEDITEYSKMLIQKNANDFPISSAEQIVIGRILVELYCQNEDSDCLRECPKKEIYPDYYVTITNPISLNDIRNRLISGTSYTLLIEILNDLDKVFENAKLYYHPQDPYHISTVLLQTYFNLMVTKWIPQFTKRDEENHH